MKLPNKIIPAKASSPRKLLLYGLPKVGKTTLLSKLKNNLIIDLESGSEYVDALKVSVSNLEELAEVCEAIKKEGYPYKYVSIDTITQLEEWCEPLAKKLYMKTPMGKNFKGESVLELPNGGGYLYLRMAVKRWLSILYTLAPHVILVGHLKDRFTDKKGQEVNSKELDLTGKIQRIVSGKADAIGYLYRKGNDLRISFMGDDEVVCGARNIHLKGEDFPIANTENKEFQAYWDKIFID